MRLFISTIIFCFILSEDKLNIESEYFLTKDKVTELKPIDFYCFTKMEYKPQPNNSNWCWSSCLESIISGTNTNSKIGKEKHEIVFSYKLYLKENEIETFNSENLNLKKCNKNPKENKCNLTIDDNHIKPLFEMAGLEIQELKSLEELNNYILIVEKLKKNKGPILLRIFKEELSHMIMIKGYGNSEGCNYLLISDPDEGIKEKYISHLNLINSSIYNIRKAWYVITQSSNNLEKDLIIEQKYNEAYKYVQYLKTLKNTSFPKKILNPWFYVSDEYNLKNLNTCMDFKRELVTNINIKYINYLDLISYNYKLNEDTYSYFNEIKTKVKVKKKNNSIYIKPVFYPRNYTFNNEWQTYEEFIKSTKMKH